MLVVSLSKEGHGSATTQYNHISHDPYSRSVNLNRLLSAAAAVVLYGAAAVDAPFDYRLAYAVDCAVMPQRTSIACELHFNTAVRRWTSTRLHCCYWKWQHKVLLSSSASGCSMQ
jgi:hypothetical protein